MGIRRALSRLLPEKQRPETPTTSIYFADPMAGQIAPSDQGGAIQRLEANVFVCKNKLVVMRHWSEPTLSYLAENPGVELIYFIDDDLWSLTAQNDLPPAYLARLERLRADFEDQLRPLTSKVVSPSAQILSQFGDKQALKLDPAMIHPMAALDHHDDLEGAVEMVFCATASHLADLGMLCDTLATLLKGSDRLRLTTFLGKQVPSGLRLDNCTHHEPQTWAEYRQTVAGPQFHIGLAPMRPTPFNTARSATRLLDHAAFGAAGIYSDTHPFSSLIETGKNGVLVKAQPEAWCRAIMDLVDDRAACRQLASGGQQSAAQIGDPARVRQFWTKILEL